MSAELADIGVRCYFLEDSWVSLWHEHWTEQSYHTILPWKLPVADLETKDLVHTALSRRVDRREASSNFTLE